MDAIEIEEFEGQRGQRGFLAYVARDGHDGRPLTGPDGESFRQLLANSARSLAAEATKSAAPRGVAKSATGLFRLRLPNA